MKGDRVEVVVEVGDGTKTGPTLAGSGAPRSGVTAVRVGNEVAATRAGRRVDVRTGRGPVEVIEVTRGGTPVRTARFMAQRVVAMVEHPASPDAGSEEVVTLHRAA